MFQVRWSGMWHGLTSVPCGAYWSHLVTFSWQTGWSRGSKVVSPILNCRLEHLHVTSRTWWAHGSLTSYMQLAPQTECCKNPRQQLQDCLWSSFGSPGTSLLSHFICQTIYQSWPRLKGRGKLGSALSPFFVKMLDKPWVLTSPLPTESCHMYVPCTR